MKSFSNTTLSRYLKALVSTAPSPGGGSAAAFVAALGFSLLGKVAGISAGKQKVSFRSELALSKSLNEKALKLSDRDAKAYDAVVKAYQKKAVTEKEKTSRRHAIDGALANSFQVPYELLEILEKGEKLRCELLRRCVGAIASDLEVAGGFFEAARKSALHLAESNLNYLKDAEKKAELAEKLRIFQ